MHLFLSSGLEGSIDLFMKEYRLVPRETPVVYIPTAENCFRSPSPVSGRGSYQCLIERGFPVTICDLDKDSPDQMKEKMESAKVIVCGGGNTYYLLYHMKKSGFDTLLPSLLKRGMIYVGSSAGSCVCSPDISYVKDQDDPAMAPELTDYTALGLVDFEIYPHCIEDYYAQNYPVSYITDALKSTAIKIFLRDSQAVVVRDDGYRILAQNHPFTSPP
jgi:dipeptidase E